MTKRRVSSRAPARGPRRRWIGRDDDENRESLGYPGWFFDAVLSGNGDYQIFAENFFLFEGGIFAGAEIVGPIQEDGKKGAKRR